MTELKTDLERAVDESVRFAIWYANFVEKHYGT